MIITDMPHVTTKNQIVNALGYTPAGGENLIAGSGTSVDLIAGDSNAFAYAVFTLTIDKLVSGETYTVSADIDVVKNNVLEKINVRPVDDSGDLSGTNCNLAIINDRICGQIKAGDDAVKILIYAGIPGTTAGNHIRISHLKVEPGTVTDPVWTPAPEDVVVRSELPTSLNVIFPKNAGAHNSVFRGNNLGTEVTAEQYAAISSGSFDNLFVGDYWTIDKVIYRIAGLDLFLHYGDTELKTHHAVVVPDAPLYNGKMNDSDTADGAYNTSLMKTSGLNDALERVKEDFGETHIIKHRALLPNAISGSSPSGWAWCDSYIDLMTERQVYGSPAWGQAEHNGYDVNTQYSRFPLFTLAPEYICACRQWWWLQDVRSASAFGYVGDAGSASCHGASASGGVRPAFLIG